MYFQKSFDETRNVTQTFPSENILDPRIRSKKNFDSDLSHNSSLLSTLQVISSGLKQCEEYKNLELQRSRSTFEKSDLNNSTKTFTQKVSLTLHMHDDITIYLYFLIVFFSLQKARI